MSIRKGNDIIASKPLIDAVPTQDSTNAVSSGGVYDALATKQATISDLATIRSGAAAGATAVQPGDLATVATTGQYSDLIGKPTIPAAQVNSDWNAVSGVAQILNKPTLGTMAAENASDYTKTSGLATVATSGNYNDLTNKPTLGTAAAANTTDFATAAQGTKADTAVQPADLATVATTGQYSDLIGKPAIPAAQVNSDWNANSGVAQILNKPTLGTAAAADTTDFATAAQGTLASTAVQPGDLATVATSGLYSDLTGTPTIPTTLAALTGDVDISTPTDGQHLVYDANDQKWKNTTSAASVSWGGITGTLSDQTDLNNALKALVPVGSVIPFAGTSAPTGFLLCDGSAVSRTTYADLFAAIGTTYGPGDGSTTFNLPDTDDRTINGAGTETLGAVSNGSLPQINGAFNAYTYNTGNPSGAFTASIQTAKVLNSGSQNNLNINTFTFSASNSSSVYWRSDNKVRARSIYMNHIIKY